MVTFSTNNDSGLVSKFQYNECFIFSFIISQDFIFQEGEKEEWKSQKICQDTTTIYSHVIVSLFILQSFAENSEIILTDV